MKFLVWVMVLLLAPFVFAQSGSIKLLALAEDSNDKASGAVADLDLRIEPGKQRVFLETFPLTKITTQISMRFAQQVACKELDIDCSDKDFFFTIRALQGVVGGPSAGSAAAVLTASLIAGFPLRNDTAITGTINSGGIIGPVGGIKEKMEAAATSGIRRVLIPQGTRELNDSNTTTDLFRYGEVLGIEVVEVATLLDALREYTGREFPNVTGELVIEPRYLETMRDVAIGLCNRTEAIKSSLEKHGKNITGIEELEREAVNMSSMASEAFDSGQYYASASFCFRGNVAYKRALAMQRNWTTKDVAAASFTLKRGMANFSRRTDSREISTITDLQTYMAVKERLADVDEIFLDIAANLNSTDDNIQRLAYAEERLFSAKTWARFFNNNDVKFMIDSASLKSSCMAKISESEERLNYVRSFLPDALGDARRELDSAYKDLESANYTICLYKASKTKAEADVILSLVGVEASRINDLIDLKLGIARNAIIRSQQKGIFPIIGYSYYEYAGSLKPIDKYSSLLFAEYALEFSNMDIYFARKKPVLLTVWQAVESRMLWVLGGIVLGILISIIVESVQEARIEMKKKH
jgi:uncharacterized protein